MAARSLEAAALAGLLGLGATGAQAQVQDPAPALRVCVAQDNPPLSWRGADGRWRGLDLRIAQAVADTLGRPLQVQAFESDYEKESTLAHEVGALLASGHCDAASGFGLLATDLGPPSRPSARSPDYPGAPRKRDRPFVALQPLAASRAYLGVALGLGQRRGDEALTALADLRSRRVGVVVGTLEGALAMGWQQGALRDAVRTLSQREDPFAALASGRVDALLLPLSRLDGERLRQSESALVVAPWRGPLGLNLGFVMLATRPQLKQAFDRVIAPALADGQLARWAAEEGLSWQPPSEPEVGPGPRLADLMQLR